MPFIGNQPALSYTSFAKQDFSTSATTSYTLDNPVANANELALFINFVRQEPTTAYSASGTSLTLTSATASSDDMYCVYLGKAVQTVNPPNASVGTSQLVDGSVTSDKLASGTGGKVLQVVTSTSSTNISTTSQTFVTTNFSLAITPSTTSSKILLMANTTAQINGSDINLDIYRSTSSSFVSGGKSRGLIGMEPANAMMSVPIIHLDSPNTTSAITYTIYFRNNGGQTSSFLRSDVLSSFTALEIGA